MLARYKLSNGKEVQIFLWSDLLEPNPYREYVEVTPLYDGKEGRTSKKQVCTDKDGAYFIWNKEKIYIHNFIFETTKSLTGRIAVALGTDDKWSVRDEDIWATMQKDTENVGFVVDLPAYDFSWESVSQAIRNTRFCAFRQKSNIQKTDGTIR